jgi:hypothetical protein
MQVKLNQFRYGPGVFNAAGQVVEVSDSEGEELTRKGYAERIETAAVQTCAPAKQKSRKEHRHASL